MLSSANRKFLFQVLALFLPLALLVIGASTHFHQDEKNDKFITSSIHESAEIKLGMNSIRQTLEHIVSDAIYFSQDQELRNFVEKHSPETIRNITQDLLNFSNTQAEYDLICWIDETGMERVCVNYNDGNPVVVPQEQLRDKREDSFFTDTVKLSQGEIHFSPLALERKQEEIEVPHKPMLRIGTPIVDIQGNKRGMVQLNYRAGNMLRDFALDTAEVRDHIMLLNHDGYWLKSPRHEDEWGFMLNREGLSLGQQHPATWQRIKKESKGQFLDADGLWTFDTVYPFLEASRISTGIAKEFSPSRSSLQNQEYQWKIVSHLSPDQLYADTSSLRTISLATVAVLLLLFAGSWALVRIRIERKNARESLQDMATKFRTVFESASDAIMLFDGNGFVDCNPATLLTFGCPTRNEFIGKHPAELSPPTQPSGEDSMSLANQYIAAAFAGGTIRFEWTHLRSDGTEFPAEVILTTMELNGKPVLQARVRNITEHKKAQASEIRYRRLFESAKDGILILDAETGMIEDANPFMTELLGYSHKELLGKHVWELGFLKNIVASKAKFLELQQQDYVRYEDLPLESAHHIIKHVEFVSNVYLVNNVKVIQCNIRDISERKKAEEDLRKLGNAIEQAADMVVITNSDGIIEYANPAFTRNTEFPQKEALGNTPHILYSGKQNDAFYKDMWTTIKSGRIWVGTLINRKKSGELYNEKMTISPISDKEGKITHFVAIKQDITRDKQLHEQLIRSEKLSTIGTFVAGVAHELNNPLTSVIGFSELLLERKNLPDDVSKKVRIIHEQSERTVRIVKNLLQFSRKSTTEKTATNINETLEKTIQLLSYRLKNDNIAVEFIPSQRPPIVNGVESEFQQTFMNILVNAYQSMVKAKQGNGLLTIRVSLQGDFVSIGIENNGPPIPSAHLHEVFDPFFTTKAPGEGTGLGLYICHNIIKEHNGDISVENIEGNGVRFTVLLPLAQARTQPAMQKEKTNAVEGLRTLMIDDEPSIREYISTLLSESGNSCLAVASAQEAMDLLKDSSFDFIISDNKMPGISGLEFGKWISENKPEMMRRFILLTGLIDPETEAFIHEHQCSLLIKPIKKENLFSAILSILDHES